MDPKPFFNDLVGSGPCAHTKFSSVKKSQKKILETPLPKKGPKIFEGFLSKPKNWLRREAFIGEMAKKACKK